MFRILHWDYQVLLFFSPHFMAFCGIHVANSHFVPGGHIRKMTCQEQIYCLETSDLSGQVISPETDEMV